MIKSREFQKLLRNFIIALLISLLISLGLGIISYNTYKNYIISNNAKIVANLIKHNPDKEEEIIKAINNNDGNIEDGYKILEEYNIEKDSLNLIKNTKNLEINIILITVFTSLISIIIISILYFKNLRKFYKKIDMINLYINDVLNDNYTLNLREYEEGTFSSLKNDVYKITNKLREQSENLLKDKKYLEQTLSDISHQLKTPLTSMNVINNLLLDDNLDKDIKKEFLAKNATQLDRIEWLVTSLLKLSKLESGTIKLKKEKVNVSKLVESALNPLRIPIELKNQTLIVEGDKKINIVADYNWTVEALVNIIKNAHEHTKEKGTIKISFEDNPLYVLIKVEDNGEGIKPKDINHIFERFYKGSSNNKESIGIGLNMSKNIIDRQNGEISVKSKLGSSTVFYIKFYKNVV